MDQYEEEGSTNQRSDLEMYALDKAEGYEYRQRRQDQWTENYELYRDTVLYNRLTQRQTVNIPLMKMSLKTLLSQYDDMPVISFENLDNDKEKEVFLNEYWKWTGERNKFDIQDIVDKKQEQFFGRTFDQWQIIDGAITQTIVSSEDILVSRYTNPININTSRYLIHMHIFVPQSVLQQNKDYDQTVLQDMQDWFATDEGQQASAQNQESFNRKQEKMADLGLQDAFDARVGETMVEITLYFKWQVDREGTGQEIYLKVIGQDGFVLMNKPLEEVIGKTKDNFWRTHYPYTSWAGDIDMQDFWVDGAADIVRTTNKILNTWYSQEVENRTMKNLNMQYWDGSAEGADQFAPAGFEPKAWGWYKVPGNPNEVIKQVQVQDLGETFDDMEFLMQINEKATGAVSTLQGTPNERQITLGEVKLDLSSAQERVKGISKFYNQVWKERAEMFLKLVEAAPDKLDIVTIYKKGLNSDKLYPRDVQPKDWQTEKGYTVRVWSQVDKNDADTASLQKWNAVKANMPQNPIVDEIYKHKLLEFAEAKPEDIKRAMDWEQKLKEFQQQMMEQAAAAGAMAGQPGGMPAQPGAQPMGQPQPMQQDQGIGAQFSQPGGVAQA